MRPRRSASIHLAGDGPFTKRCHQWIEERTGCAKALLTTSCTSALDLAALLIDIKSGDEVILPSYTFVSTANAFVLRGAVPVFVDIREDTLNLDERLIEAAITPRTRAMQPCITPASPAGWTPSLRSPDATIFTSSKMLHRESSPATRGARWVRSATSALSAFTKRKTLFPVKAAASS